MSHHLTLVALVTFAASRSALAADAVVENDYLRLRLSPRGELVSLFDKKAGRELASGVRGQALFQLEFCQADDLQKRSRVTSADAAKVGVEQLQAGAQRIVRLAFSGLGPGQVSARCEFSAQAGDRYVRCRMSVGVPTGLVLESARFPIVVLRTPTGPDPADALVFGTTKGGVWRRPSQWKTGRWASGGQPGNLAAQFGCYYEPSGGLMIAAFDSRGYRKTITATRIRDGLALAWQQACFERSTFAHQYDLVLTSFSAASPDEPADWRDAADLYKQWAVHQPWCKRTLGERDDLPAWLKQGPAMVRFGRDWLAKPERIEGWLKKYWQPGFAGPWDKAGNGSPLPLIIAYWGWEKHGDWITPDYFPVFPSEEQFARLVRLGREFNGHTFLWPSGYHYTVTYQKQPDGSFAWDDRARFNAEAAPHATHGRDGRPLIGDRFWLQGGQTAAMCPGDPWTIEWFNRIAVELVKRGADMVQVDQVVGGNFPVCYRANHGHTPGAGLWTTDVIHRQLETMSAACRKINPQTIVCFEEPNEWFIQHAGIQDYRDWEVMRRGDAEPASVFNYLYHEYLPTFQSNPAAGDRLSLAHCLVTGQIPHMVPRAQIGPGPLVIDGGFEEWVDCRSPGWNKVEEYQGRVYGGRATGDAAVRHGGRASLRLDNADGEIVQVSQNVSVGKHFAAGRRYRLSAWIKTADLAQPNAIGMATFAAGMRATGSWRIPLPKPGEWALGHAEFTVPESSQMLRIMIHVNGRARLWVDDVRLEELLSDGRAIEVQRQDEPEEHRLVRAWVELFHGRGRPWLLLGRMLHPPRLECDTLEFDGRRFPVVLHNAFASPDGREAVVLANPSDKLQHATLAWHGKSMQLELAPDEVRLVTEPK